MYKPPKSSNLHNQYLRTTITLTCAESRQLVGKHERCSVRGQWRRRASTAAPLIPAGSAADAGCRHGTRRRQACRRRRKPEVLEETTAARRR